MLKKITNLYERFDVWIYKHITRDALFHFGIMAILATLLNIFLPWYIVGGICVVISVVKEIFDKTVRHFEFSIPDLIADLIGITIGLL